MGAWGLKTLMSKNALVSGAHSPNALTSALAPSDLFDPAGRSSPVADCKAGSDRTSLHISVRSLCVVSLTALCLMLMKPPFLQVRLIEYGFPQAHDFETSLIFRSYLNVIASTNSCLFNRKPNCFNGSDVSQLEAPFSDDNSISLKRSSDITCFISFRT